MDIQAIKDSVECYWSKADESFVVTSPLCTNIAGVEETKEAAYEMFYSMLEEAYEFHLQGCFTPMKKKSRKASNPGTVLSFRASDIVIEFLRSQSKETNQTLGSVIDKYIIPHIPADFIRRK